MSYDGRSNGSRCRGKRGGSRSECPAPPGGNDTKNQYESNGQEKKEHDRMTNPVPDINEPNVPRIMYALGICRGVIARYEASLTQEDKILLSVADRVITEESYRQRIKNLSQ